MKTKAVTRPTDEEIARKAYELFEARGRLSGHEREDWLAAEQELLEQRRPKPPRRARQPAGRSARPREI